jgi:hypothetical protein
MQHRARLPDFYRLDVHPRTSELSAENLIEGPAHLSQAEHDQRRLK